MNNVDTMTKLLEEDPDNLIGAAMLTDALIEERDMTRSEAERYAERVQQSARDARDLGLATALLAADSGSRGQLLELIADAALCATSGVTTVVVVTGDADPEVKASRPLSPMGQWFAITITVGAGWVLDAYRRNCPPEPPQKLRRGTSKRKR